MENLRKSKKQFGRVFFTVVLVTSLFVTLFPVFSVSAAPTALTLKWTGSVAGGGESLLVADIRSDYPGEEVVHCGGGVQPASGPGRVTVLNGRTGAVIQSRSIEGLGDTAQAQMADVDNDGRLEIIVPLQQPAGLYILNSEDLSILWNAPGSYSGDPGYFTNPSGGRVDSSPVIGDIDGDGYKDIFVGIMAYENQPETGSIRHLEYQPGVGIVQRNIRIVWHPCAGGLSLGDTDNDGVYELYMADRSQGGMSDGSWGRGLRSFWAENLTSRWDVYDNMMSSNIPMLADVNGDGIRDVVATDLSRAVMVLDSSNGHPLVNDDGVVLRESITERRNHYQSSVCDIDGDGNLEILSADGFEAGYDYVTVWDLWDWSLDAIIDTTAVGPVPTRSWKGPTAGEVTGDGILDMIVVTFDPNNGNNGQVQVYDHNFDLIYLNTGLRHRAIDAVVQDVDRNDGGLNELLVLTQGGIIYCFETPGIASSPRARTEVQFYSESRLGASQYVAYEPPSTSAYYPQPPTVPNQVPTQGTPQLTGSTTLVCTNQSTNDNDGDDVTNVYSWTRNGVSFANLILPFGSMTDPEDEYSGFAYTRDYSGYDNVGNVFGATWINDGVRGGAYSFDGNDFIRVEEQGNSLGGDGSWDEITVEFWVKATQNTGFEYLLWKHNRYDNTAGYRVDFSASDIDNQIRWNVYTGSTSAPTTYQLLATIGYGPRDWHHVVCTYNSGQGLKIYVDGSESASLAGASGNIVQTNGNTRNRDLGDYLGDWGYLSGGMVDTNKGPLDITRGRPGGDFIGMLDEIKIYSSELSSAQIQQNYVEAMNGESSSAIIVSQETTTGETWRCRVTPNDGKVDGNSLLSNSVVVSSGGTTYTLNVNIVGQGSVQLNPAGGTYASGTVVGLTAVPNSGWSFAGWSGDLTGSTNPTSITMNSAKTVTATFTLNAPVQRTLTVNIVGNGNVNLNPSGGTYNDGTVVTLTAVEGSGYTFSAWSGDLTGSTNPTSITMNSDKTVTATFTASGGSYLFSDGYESGNFAAWTGTTTVSGTASVTTSTVHTGTYSGQFDVNSGSSARRAYSYINVGSLTEVIASAYVYIPSSLSLSNGQKLFLVQLRDSSSQPIACYGLMADTSGTRWVVQSGNSPYSLGSVFSGSSGWYLVETYYIEASSGPTLALSVNGVQVATLNQNTANNNNIASAWFGNTYFTGSLALTIFVDDVVINPSGSPPDTYTLTINTVGSGTVNLNPIGGTYVSGTVVGLTAVPNSGWSFAGWSGDLTGSTNPTSITMNSAKTVTATFTQNPPTQRTLIVNIVGNGNVNLNPSGGTYNDGTVVTLTAVAGSGYTFSSWSGDLTGSTNPETITMNSDKTVTATFTVNGGSYLFSDGYESGNFAAWTGTTTVSGTASVTTSTVHTGTYSGQFDVNSGSSARRAYSHINVGSLTEVIASDYVYIPSSLSLANGQKLFFIQLRDSGSQPIASYGLMTDSTGMRWAIQSGNWPYSLGDTFSGSSGWYLLEIYYVEASSGPTLALSVNGVQVASLNQNTTNNNNIASAWFGNTYFTGSSALTIFVDDVIIE